MNEAVTNEKTESQKWHELTYSIEMPVELQLFGPAVKSTRGFSVVEMKISQLKSIEVEEAQMDQELLRVVKAVCNKVREILVCDGVAT